MFARKSCLPSRKRFCSDLPSSIYNHALGRFDQDPPGMELKEIAGKLGARLDPPDAQMEISGVGAIDSAVPGQITFALGSKFAALARTTRASALIVDEKFPALEKPTLRIKNPQLAYARAVELLHKLPQEKRGVHPTAVIDPSARIGANPSIGACVVIGADVEIGEGCTLLPHVVIYRGVRIGKNFFAHSHVAVRENCEIGNDVLLHNGVVIGSDGFGLPRTTPATGTRSRRPAAWCWKTTSRS